jgi:hypothetical protein
MTPLQPQRRQNGAETRSSKRTAPIGMGGEARRIMPRTHSIPSGGVGCERSPTYVGHLEHASSRPRSPCFDSHPGAAIFRVFRLEVGQHPSAQSQAQRLAPCGRSCPPVPQSASQRRSVSSFLECYPPLDAASALLPPGSCNPWFFQPSLQGFQSALRLLLVQEGSGYRRAANEISP